MPCVFPPDDGKVGGQACAAVEVEVVKAARCSASPESRSRSCRTRSQQKESPNAQFDGSELELVDNAAAAPQIDCSGLELVEVGGTSLAKIFVSDDLSLTRMADGISVAKIFVSDDISKCCPFLFTLLSHFTFAMSQSDDTMHVLSANKRRQYLGNLWDLVRGLQWRPENP
jgi:predicted DNA-binding protein YlxM (UPF0122 family)